MLLSEFFFKLICKVHEAHKNEGLMPFIQIESSKKKIIYHLEQLKLYSEKPENFWYVYKKNISASWKIVLTDSKRYYLFDEFKGQEELRAKLKLFLSKN